MIKSVIITLYDWVLVQLYAVPASMYDSLFDSCVKLQESEAEYSRQLDKAIDAKNDLKVRLENASEANAELQCKLKQVTFLENRVRELEGQLNKQKIEPKKVVDEKQPIITGRAGWRAIAQMRSMATMQGPEPDSVKQLENRVAKETN